MVNYILECFNWSNIPRRSRGGVHKPRRYTFKCYLSAILAVILYGSVEFGLAFNEIPELSGSGFNLVDGLAESRIDFWLPNLGDRVYAFKFSENFTSKDDGSIIELLGLAVFSCSALGQEMINEGSEQISCNSAQGENSDIINRYWHPWSLIAGLSAGAWLAIFVVDIVPLLLRLFYR